MSTWDSIKGAVGKVAPVLGSALGGPAGGAVGSLIAGALGTNEDPDEIAQALKADPEAAVKLQRLEHEHERELRRMAIESETTRLQQTQQTMRAEITSKDAYVRRARPSFLYIVAFSVFVEVIIALVVVIRAPGNIGDLATLYNALAIPQGIAAAMCGVYLKKRSDDKAVASGQEPGGIGKALAGLIARK